MAGIQPNFSRDAFGFLHISHLMSQSESRCGYYERGPNLHLELFAHWHVYCRARWKQRDVPLQCPQLDTGECFMYCTMTEFTETWWWSLFHSVFLHLSFCSPYNCTSAYSQQESQACLGKSHVKTCTVVYLLFIITFSSKIPLGRLLHSSQLCSLYLPFMLIADRHSHTYISL